MSASSKKKLRNAEQAEKMTEKQLAEQKEAKKLKIYTAVFAVVLAVMVVFAAWTMISKAITHNGVFERNTVALTVGDHEISNAELGYFYIDSINNFYNNYGNYASMFGLDVTAPLDQQYVNEEEGLTWADDFLNSAMKSAKAVYALVDEANAAGFTLGEEDQAEIDTALTYMDLYATAYGYSNTDDYIKAIYGNGADAEGLRAYYELTYLADSYQTYYTDNLTYDDAAMQAESEANYAQYCDYDFSYAYLNVNKFLTGGTTDEDGNTTYTDEEKAAAVEAAEAAAQALVAGEYADSSAFEAAVAAIETNDDTAIAATVREDYAYTGVTSNFRDWATDTTRVPGDTHYVASTSTSTADDGTETTTTNGFYVVVYFGTNENEYPLANVRHILVKFEGGTTDETTGTTTYSDEEKAAAKSAAEELYFQWKSGEATEESFAALANENSDDGDGTTGGLYEDIYPGQMVTNFNDWCFAEGRQAGDTEVIETEYGYHIMYYVGDSETTYRSYLIREALVEADYTEWYNTLVEAMPMTEGNTKYINKSLIIGSAG